MRKMWTKGVFYLGMAAMLAGCGQNMEETCVWTLVWIWLGAHMLLV